MKSINTSQHLLFDVLSSTSSKREAKSYLSRFSEPSKKPKAANNIQPKAVSNKKADLCHGVNLGSLFLPIRAVDESPVFNQIAPIQTFVDPFAGPLHVALVHFRSTDSIEDETLRGIGRTLSQLTTLGLSCVVVVDAGPEQEKENTASNKHNLAWRDKALEQADRVAAGIELHSKHGARRLDSVVAIMSLDDYFAHSVKVRGRTQIANRKLLLTPLRRGLIPVIAPIGYTIEGQKIGQVEASEVVLALAREFAGIVQSPTSEEDPLETAERINAAQNQISLDRVIVLDPSGGIPSMDKGQRPHIFINLEQEYHTIYEELKSHVQPQNLIHPNVNDRSAVASSQRQTLHLEAALENMELVKNTLAILPPSSSAILITPQEAANSSQHTTPSTPGVGTRSQRNALIHNLLTDKPIFSSSLPQTRVSGSNSLLHNTPSPPTFFKRGMPVTIIPSPQKAPWEAPSSTSSALQMSDPRIDLPRLVHLIEDSFGRKLDVQHYLARLSTSLAGIIIAGEYEGAAILTWETPPSLPSTLLPGTPEHTSRLVPYLDKFAVLRRSQGAGGVADIVFSAMVRECFPKGVVWRSRRGNPVNKWYFERARGMWKIPTERGEGWTMFWTTEGVGDRELFMDYAAVCAGVGTSWADGKERLD